MGHGEKDGEIRGWGDGGKKNYFPLTSPPPHLPISPPPQFFATRI